MITRLSNENTTDSLSFFFANTVPNNSTRMLKCKSIMIPKKLSYDIYLFVRYSLLFSNLLT